MKKLNRQPKRNATVHNNAWHEDDSDAASMIGNNAQQWPVDAKPQGSIHATNDHKL